MDVRQRINDNPLLAPVLKWDSDDGTLSGSEAALVRIVQALAADLDALDADQQQALEDLGGGNRFRDTGGRAGGSRTARPCLSRWVVVLVVTSFLASSRFSWLGLHTRGRRLDPKSARVPVSRVKATLKEILEQ